MNSYRRIVHTDKRSDGLSKRPDSSNTPTRQSAGTNDAPRDPLHAPITWNPPHSPTLRLHLSLCLQYRATPKPPRVPCRCVKRPHISACVIQCETRHRYQKFHAACWLRFDLNHKLQVDSNHWFCLDLNHWLRLDSNFCLRLDLTCWVHLDPTYRF